MSDFGEIVDVAALVREALEGPIHGRIQALRGMCTDEDPHTEIDRQLAALDEVVHHAITVLRAAQS